MTESKWIPVSERKPDNARTVWLAIEGEVVRGFHIGCFYHDLSGHIKPPVTHWQEIAEEPPATPKRVRRVEVGVDDICGRGVILPRSLPPDATNITVSYDTED